MKFLRIMGGCFLVAGLAVYFTTPMLHAMAYSWIGVGALLIVIAQMAAGSEANRQRLLQTGKAGKATILSVTDTGVTINNNPRVRVHVRIEVPGAAPIEATNAMMVSRVSIPDVGDVYNVRFDAADPNNFTFAPSSGERAASSHVPEAPAGDDMLGQLERLTTLRDKGALTPAEFEAQKKKLLGGG